MYKLHTYGITKNNIYNYFQTSSYVYQIFQSYVQDVDKYYVFLDGYGDRKNWYTISP